MYCVQRGSSYFSYSEEIDECLHLAGSFCNDNVINIRQLPRPISAQNQSRRGRGDLGAISVQSQCNLGAISVQSWHNLDAISVQSRCSQLHPKLHFSEAALPPELSHSTQDIQHYEFTSKYTLWHTAFPDWTLVINYLKVRRDKITNITTAQPLSEAGSLFKHNLPRLGSLWISILQKDACSTNGRTIM